MKQKLLLVVCAVLLTSLNASAGILDGWTKMETNVIDNPQDYYFIILHSDNSLMLGITKTCSTDEAGTNNSETSSNYDFISYQTASEPCSDLTKVWAIEKCTHASHTSSYTFRSLANVDCPAWSERDATWGPFNLRTNGNVHENNAINAAMNLAFESSYWHIQDAQQTDYFWGPWSDAAYVNNERVAGNAGGNGNAEGSYNIYYMLRSTFNKKYQFFGGTDMNHAIVNRDFEYGSLTGWTNVRNTTYQCLSNSDAKKNHIGTDTSFGTHYAYLYLAWDANGDGKLEQTVSNLPDGKYSSTIYLCNDVNYVFNGTSAESWGLEKTPADTWTPITVGNQNITDGSTTLSIRDYWDSATDNASLTFIPNNVSDDASAYTLGSTTVPLTWYSITIPENGDYILMSTAASSILYTTNSTDKPATTTKTTLDAGGTLDLNDLTAGTLYVGTTAATKLALINVKGDDLTYLIANPSFEAGKDNWICTNVTSGPNRENSSPTPSDGSWRAGFWNSSLTGDIDLYQSVTLPAGYYRLEFDAYNNGDNTNKWKEVQPYFGATKSAKLPYEEPRNQWRTISFVFNVDATTTANLGVTFTPTSTGQIWENVDNFRLTYLGDTHVAAEKALLLEEITTADGIYNNGANVGSGVFQIPVAAGTAFVGVINAAREIYGNEDATADEVTDAIDALEAAEETFASATLNAPDAAKRYWITMHDAGKAWDGFAVTFEEGGRSGEGDYAVKYLAAASANYNQALKFTVVEGNKYKISGIRVANAGEQYLTGKLKGYSSGSNDQIRTTDDASKALEITVQATTTANQFKLINETGTEISRNSVNPDNGVYASGDVGSYFTLAEATQAEVTVSCKAGKYGTVIFPFTPDVSEGFDGIKFYSCTEVNSETSNLQLTEEVSPAANTPYIIKNTNRSDDFSKNLSGWGTAKQDSYTTGLLTGVYTAATIPASASNYVLQTHDDGVQAFYSVDAAFTATPYKAFLTHSGGSVKAFGFDIFDAINAIEAAENEKTEIFNLAGQRLSKLQKGVNIVNGKKVLVK